MNTVDEDINAMLARITELEAEVARLTEALRERDWDAGADIRCPNCGTWVKHPEWPRRAALTEKEEP